MSPKVIASIKARLRELGYSADPGDQLWIKGDRCVILGRDNWNIGSLSNTSWPGVTGRSLKSFLATVR